MLDMWENWHPPGPLWFERMGRVAFDEEGEEFEYVDGEDDGQAVAAGSSPASSLVMSAIPPPQQIRSVPVTPTSGAYMVNNSEPAGRFVLQASPAMRAAQDAAPRSGPAPIPGRPGLVVQNSILQRLQASAGAGGSTIRALGPSLVRNSAATASMPGMQGLGAEPSFDPKSLVVPAAVVAGGYLLYRVLGKKKPKRESPTKVFNFG